MSEYSSRDVLLLFTAGGDSILTVCRLVEKGYRVNIAGFDNGCLGSTEHFATTADKLINLYGPEKMEYAGCFRTSGIVRQLLSEFDNTEIGNLSEKYPSVIAGQVRCLACHLAMWSCAIGYCKALKIPNLAAFYSARSGNIMEGISLQSHWISLAERYSIMTLFPVYDIVSRELRNDMLSNRGLVLPSAKVTCWLSSAGTHTASISSECNESYFLKEMLPKAYSIIEEQIEIFTSRYVT